MSKGIILFGHGSRSAEYTEPFNRVRAAVAAGRPDLPVELGFLELTQPPLETAIEALVAHGVTQVVVVPIFFAPGKHVLKDLPQRIGDAMDRFPTLEFEIAACVGEVDGVVAAMAAHALASA
jgi:sirohydrochlorin cobaltochelatase